MVAEALAAGPASVEPVTVRGGCGETPPSSTLSCPSRSLPAGRRAAAVAMAVGEPMGRLVDGDPATNEVAVTRGGIDTATDPDHAVRSGTDLRYTFSAQDQRLDQRDVDATFLLATQMMDFRPAYERVPPPLRGSLAQPGLGCDEGDHRPQS